MRLRKKKRSNACKSREDDYLIELSCRKRFEDVRRNEVYDRIAYGRNGLDGACILLRSRKLEALSRLIDFRGGERK